MPANNLIDGFDLSRDQDKLNLLSDLASLQSAINSLRKKQEQQDTAREFSPVFPATLLLVPDIGGVAGGSYFATWAAIGSDAVSGFGYTTNTLELDEGYIPQEYAILGQESRGAWSGTPVGATAYQGLIFSFQVPKGITGWKASAIEFDWRSSTSSSVSTGMSWTIRVAGVAVATGTTIFTGSGAEDTGWTRTVLATGSEMGTGYSITPGTRFEVEFLVHGSGGSFYIGNLHFNWK